MFPLPRSLALSLTLLPNLLHVHAFHAIQSPLARALGSAAVTNTGAIPFPSDLCAINAWPTEQQGAPYTPQLPDAELTEILNQVDPERIRAYVEKLVTFGTRHTLSVQDDPVRG